MKRIALIAPVHNEEGNLERFFERARLAASTISERAHVDFVFVDDASTDASPEHLQELSLLDERVTVIRLVRNFGAHMAIKAGLASVEADYYAVLSADLQDPPELVAEFFNKVEDDRTDVVWGVRASRADPVSKRIMAAAFYGVMRKVAIPNLPEKGVDTFLISRRVRDDYLSIQERNTMPYYLMMWLGYPQSFVPYHRDARHSGVSKWTFRKRLKNALDSILSFSAWPIRVITYVGIGTCSIAFALALYLLFNRIAGNPSPGWTGMALLISIATGIQTLMLAILAQYVWRISDAVRGRPEYLIDRITRGRQVVLTPTPRSHDVTPSADADAEESTDPESVEEHVRS